MTEGSTRLNSSYKSCTVDNVTDDQAPLPTVGYSTRTLAVGRYNILLTEVGGGKNIRGIWPKYFAQVGY